MVPSSTFAHALVARTRQGLDTSGDALGPNRYDPGLYVLHAEKDTGQISLIANPGLIAIALPFCFQGRPCRRDRQGWGGHWAISGYRRSKPRGGTGALFNYAKQKHERAHFCRPASGLPGLDGPAAKAPSLGGTSEGKSSGLSSALGSKNSMLGEGNGTNELGAAAALAEPFALLGSDPAMTRKFIGRPRSRPVHPGAGDDGPVERRLVLMCTVLVTGQPITGPRVSPGVNHQE